MEAGLSPDLIPTTRRRNSGGVIPPDVPTAAGTSSRKRLPRPTSLCREMISRHQSRAKLAA